MDYNALLPQVASLDCPHCQSWVRFDCGERVIDVLAVPGFDEAVAHLDSGPPSRFVGREGLLPARRSEEPLGRLMAEGAAYALWHRRMPTPHVECLVAAGFLDVLARLRIPPFPDDAQGHPVVTAAASAFLRDAYGIEYDVPTPRVDQIFDWLGVRKKRVVYVRDVLPCHPFDGWVDRDGMVVSPRDPTLVGRKRDDPERWYAPWRQLVEQNRLPSPDAVAKSLVGQIGRFRGAFVASFGVRFTSMDGHESGYATRYGHVGPRGAVVAKRPVITQNGDFIDGFLTWRPVLWGPSPWIVGMEGTERWPASGYGGWPIEIGFKTRSKGSSRTRSAVARHQLHDATTARPEGFDPLKR